MAPLTDEQKKIRKARKIIKDFRASEEDTRAVASSRSTGIRNVYKRGYETIAAIEELLNSRA